MFTRPYTARRQHSAKLVDTLCDDFDVEVKMWSDLMKENISVSCMPHKLAILPLLLIC